MGPVIVRSWLASGLVALLCVACDLPIDGQGDPPPEAGAALDASDLDTYVPVTHFDAGAGPPDDSGRPFPKPKEAGAWAPDAGALDAPSSSDSPGEEGDAAGADGGDESGGQGGDRPVEGH